MISIDQNCHTLWDVVPKLQAISRKGIAVTQYVEDIDVAFTSMGSDVHAPTLRLERERYYRSGGADWGAALFYSEFLGRLPLDVRALEPYTGLKSDVLARQLGVSLDELYDRLSGGDNWQLIGPSYVGDRRHHRTIGDVSIKKVAPFVRQVLQLAQDDCRRCFPQEASRRRVDEWFARERARVEELLTGDIAALDQLYFRWLEQCCSGCQVTIANASSLFGPGDNCGDELLRLFLDDYSRLADLYNQAIEESRVGLRLLKKADGELPFFGAYEYQDHYVRSQAFIDGPGVRFDDHAFSLNADGTVPYDQMRRSGFYALSPKAILLVLQVRMGPKGRALALPYHGSIYMPAAFRLQSLLEREGLLTREVKPVNRVRFHFLDRLKELDTVICLPEHLVWYFGRQEIPAREVGHNWQSIQEQARGRLESFRDPAMRRQWQDRQMGDLSRGIQELDARRRELAKGDQKNPELREIWKRIKPLQLDQLRGLLEQVARDWQASQIDYWDSRGALLPWAVALGGERFYDQLLDRAEIYEDRAT